MVTRSLRYSGDRVADLMEFARITSEARDIGWLRSQTLPLIRRLLESDSTIIWLVDRDNKLVQPVEKNIQHGFFPLYRDHYFRKNPFDPSNVMSFANGAVTMEQIVPYHDFQETEYYNDFIRPQKIRRQMVVYIREGRELTSLICTHRTKNRQFDREDLAAGNMVSSQLSAAFGRIRMVQEAIKKRGFFQMLLESTDVGIAALDFERNFLFINRQAERICGSVRSETLSKHECRRGTSVIPASVLKDLEALQVRFRNDQKIGIDSFPEKERIISTGKAGKFRFRARLVNGRLPDVDGPLFLITMEALPLYAKLDQRAAKEMCHFTKRESEIVSYIFKGYRNAEIAQSLFISEGTVKNHLRNIFEKAEVKNRTGLIHRVLSL